MSPADLTPGRKVANGARWVALALSAGLWAALSLCYWGQPDACAAITLWPPWVWLAPGLLLAGLGWSRPGKRIASVIALLWLVYLLAFVEEPRSLLRFRWGPSSEWQAARQRRQALRVVSLNCAAGNQDAAAEVERWQPDIALLQEAPVRRDTEALACRLFGRQAAVVWGGDVAILARGTVFPTPPPRALRAFLAQGRVRLTTGSEVEVISIHLLPPVFRTDLWSAACWRDLAANRQARREQVQALAQQIARLPGSAPLIVGGDFNAPAGDAVFRLLAPRLHDAFGEGGMGWGNTVLNDMPLSRIDQVWISEHFRAPAVTARKTRHSDHRMVICDLVVR
ncbi:MAG: endonuclease/exonuclease/phosphatase family protein [Armatimonadetes bacterium]|nr:endonuclease/exonuclease/phosphatase family protein [Armatimonadota bacterium]